MQIWQLHFYLQIFLLKIASGNIKLIDFKVLSLKVSVLCEFFGCLLKNVMRNSIKIQKNYIVLPCL